MEQEKVCRICGQVYNLKPETLASSSVNITLELDTKTRHFDFDSCSGCAYKILRYINSLQAVRPRKCDFCMFDKGPRAKVKNSECEECHGFDNFQLKKRMHPRQAYEWDKYKRYFGEEENK